MQEPTVKGALAIVKDGIFVRLWRWLFHISPPKVILEREYPLLPVPEYRSDHLHSLRVSGVICARSSCDNIRDKRCEGGNCTACCSHQTICAASCQSRDAYDGFNSLGHDVKLVLRDRNGGFVLYCPLCDGRFLWCGPLSAMSSADFEEIFETCASRRVRDVMES